MTKTQLPDVLQGHWTTPSGHDMAERVADLKRHEIGFWDATDFDLAHRCGMADGRTIADTAVLLAAKDRIRWLSVQLALANLRAQKVNHE